MAEVGPEDDSHRKVHENKLSELKNFFHKDSLTVKYLPWDKHNVHMNINEKGNGIYFYRRYKSPIFTPVYIDPDSIEDCEILKSEFKMFDERAYEK